MSEAPRRKRFPEPPHAALTLRAPDGAPLYTFPAGVVGVVRRAITGLSFRGGLPRRLALIATLQREGVTYTTLALATTIASDMDVSVCAVELNWWSPGMHNQLSQLALAHTRMLQQQRKRKQPVDAVEPVAAPPSSLGLAGVLDQQVSLDSALLRTNRPNLALLPAGAMDPDRRPVMARSGALRECIEQLSLRFDHIVFDVPAIMATSDAIALASLSEACCVVVRQGVTPVNSVRLALDEVQHLPMLGVILNRVQIQTPAWVRALVPQE